VADYDIPQELRYTREDEWVRLEGERVVLGVTDYAQQQLGDVVYVELPEVGRVVSQGEVFGTIESVKAVSELFSPASGEVIAVNTELSNKPEQINADPHASWIIRLKLRDAGETAALLDATAYTALTK
jgi:glycine cleavage system H protein